MTGSYESGLGDAIAGLKRRVPARPEARARLSRALRAQHDTTLQTMRSRAGRGPGGRRIVFSPLAFVAVSVVLVALGVLGGRLTSPTSRMASNESPATTPAPGAIASLPASPGAVPSVAPATVSFVFVSDAARSVVLVGDFNGWSPTATPLHRADGNGTWRVSLELTPGLYTYSFLIDGVEWRSDPVAPAAPGEDFGQPSSVLLVQPAT